MKDLTQGSIQSHIVTMAVPIAIGMFTQMAYQLVDLYFVTRIGVDATAGVNTAGNAMFIIMALTQVLSVGTVALIAHAVGRKDQADANLVFNQSMSLSIVAGIATMVLMYTFMRGYLETVAADEGTIEQGAIFMSWLLPGFALMFPMTAIGAALRGTGIVQPTIVIQMVTVLINAILAPILIAGWGTGMPLGVKGAALASSISILLGVVLMALYFRKLEHYVAIQSDLMRPKLAQWARMLKIGLPSGGEFVLMFLFTAVTYYVIRNFGASAQAGFGIGTRVLQAILLPAMAISFAIGPIAGQNFGARNPQRVRETFRQALIIGMGVMIVITIFAQWRPQALVGVFKADAESIAVAALFLQLISWNFVTQGIIFTCSNMFQGMGNTLPSLLSSASRFVVFLVCAIWLSAQPDFKIEQVWYLWIGTAILQAVLSLVLLQAEFKKRLGAISVPVANPA